MKEIQGENWLTVSEIAKILRLKTDKNKICGRTLMFKILKHNHILLEDNSPTQSLVNLDLACLKVVEKNCMCYTISLFSIRGLEYLKNGFSEGRFKVEYQPTKRIKRIVKLDNVC